MENGYMARSWERYSHTQSLRRLDKMKHFHKIRPSEIEKGHMDETNGHLGLSYTLPAHSQMLSCGNHVRGAGDNPKKLPINPTADHPLGHCDT